MLLELHVKNLALIERADVEFEEGLNILTGETGAGKSIIIGSVNMALGGKVSKDMIRTGAEFGFVELVFHVSEDSRMAALAKLGVEPDENGILIITRKIMPTRSISKVNEETVTSSRLKQITGLLIDIHGQHEHQSLLYRSKHLEILDTYGKSQIQELKLQVEEFYQQYKTLKAELEEGTGDVESRKREADFLRFEIEEIETAAVGKNEEEELTVRYRRMANSQKISAALSIAHQAIEQDTISRALAQLDVVADYDEQIKPLRDQLYDADSIINDVSHGLLSYMDDMSFDEEAFATMEERLDLIHTIQSKYGDSFERIEQALKEKQERLEQLDHYEEYCAKLQAELGIVTAKLDDVCGKLSKHRQKEAKKLTELIREGLCDLNFLNVVFEMQFTKLDHYTAGGYDEAEFMISTNPGEPVRPLGNVASGGELSRIMLAIKTVLADSDEIPTLIFDEIDTGISGRTAQKVSEKLSVIASKHQVICITHLPQIAAMADIHFEIAKQANEGRTATNIHRLSREEVVTELARLLGGVTITDAVLQNAREIKEQADFSKQKNHR